MSYGYFAYLESQGVDTELLIAEIAGNIQPILRRAGASESDLRRLCCDHDLASAIMTILWASRDPRGRERVIKLLKKFRSRHSDFGGAW